MNPFLRLLKQRAELDDFWILPTPPQTGRSAHITHSPASEIDVEEPLPNREQSELLSLPMIHPNNPNKLQELQQHQSLPALYDAIHQCRDCPLGSTRTKFVFGVGSEQAELVLIGEAPGADEDRQGIPFVGRAGQLLTELLKGAGIVRDDVYICNVLKCRPPNNRDPVATEVAECESYLHRQLEILQPKLLVSLGRIAAQTLLQRPTATLGSLRMAEHSYHGIPMLVTYHPAYILRDINRKGEGIADFERIRARFIELGGTRGLQ